MRLILALLLAGQALLPNTQPITSMEDDAADGQVISAPADPYDIRWATREDFDGRLPFCTGYFRGDRWEESGSGWATDYPNAGRHFLRRIGELTKVEPGASIVVKLDDPLLMYCPFVFMSDVGILRLEASEVEGLRTYLRRGGFVWVDDFWGPLAWDQWAEEFARVWPMPWEDVPADHPIRHALYDVPILPQVPHVGFWTSTMRTSERGDESPTSQFKGARDEARQRYVAVASHNTDLADTWEEEFSSEEYFRLFSPRGYASGINVVLYALSH